MPHRDKSPVLNPQKTIRPELLGIGKPMIALHGEPGFQPPVGEAVTFTTRYGQILEGETVLIEAGGQWKKHRLGFFYVIPSDYALKSHLLLDNDVVSWQLREDDRDPFLGTHLGFSAPPTDGIFLGEIARKSERRMAVGAAPIPLVNEHNLLTQHALYPPHGIQVHFKAMLGPRCGFVPRTGETVKVTGGKKAIVEVAFVERFRDSNSYTFFFVEQVQEWQLATDDEHFITML